MRLEPLSLFSEPYGSTGNIGENFRRLLGAPGLDPLQTLVREAVQNIGDAATLGHGPEIIFRIRTLTNGQRQALSDYVFTDLTEEENSRRRFREFLDKESPVVLEICDFHTGGLRGPTRADRIPIGTDKLDFINFLRNIGSPRDTSQGGGTYGFGKVALYRASRCSTILVDTLTADQPGIRRLIGCHIGASFERPEDGMSRRFTGRHWWGRPDPKDGVVDPVEGANAAEIAAALGFLPRGPGRTGTSIMILDFDTEDENHERIGRSIVDSLLWNFWPRIMRDTPPDRRFACYVEVDGKTLDVPDPDELPGFELFTKAMRAARTGSGNDVRRIASQRPIKDLGVLAIETGRRTLHRHSVVSYDAFPDPCRHIALMRPVELVVKYLEGEALPDDRLEWGGVFITSSDDDVEQAFAESEPPAHDDWIPDNLQKGPAKTYVNVALRTLKAHAINMGALPERRGGEVVGPPLARVAGKLGMALEGVSGDGAGRNRGSGGGGGQRSTRPRATRPEFQRLERDAQGIVAIFHSDVRQGRGCSGLALLAVAAIAVEGASIAKIDDPDLRPQVLSIKSLTSGAVSASDRIDLEKEDGEYEIRVRVPPECAVTVDVNILMEEGEWYAA